MKKLFSLIISVAILFAIYQKMDTSHLWLVLVSSDKVWLSISLLMVIPITMSTVLRFQIIAPPGARVGFAEGTRLILAGSSLNMVLPSKMGDLAKAHFMQKERSIASPLAYALVVYEKATDLLALLAWCLLGLLIFAGKEEIYAFAAATVGVALAFGIAMLRSKRMVRLVFLKLNNVVYGRVRKKISVFQDLWEEVVRYTLCSRTITLRIVIFSLFIWLLHLVQIWLFILSLHAYVPFFTSLILTPLAILAGLLPLTFAGIGTRDAALIALYIPFFDKPTCAALGILCTMRYIIPAIFGLPFLRAYMVTTESSNNKP